MASEVKRGRGVYCSRLCANVTCTGRPRTVGKVRVKCLKCLNWRWIYKHSDRSLPSKCIACYNKSKNGAANPNWKGGITPENKRIRASEAYQEWRKAVFTRDKYTCVWCKQVGWPLRADHIKPFSTHPDLRFSVENGRTLCVECHKKTPTYLGGARRKHAKHEYAPSTATGRLRPEQKEFLDRVRANGGVALVARSVNDLVKEGL